MSRRGRAPVPSLPADVWQQIQLACYKEKHAALRQQMTLMLVNREVRVAVDQPVCWRALFVRFWSTPGLAWETQRLVLRTVYRAKLHRDALIRLLRKQPAIHSCGKWLTENHNVPGIAYMRRIRQYIEQHECMMPAQDDRNEYRQRLDQLELVRKLQTGQKRRYRLKKGTQIKSGE